MMLCSALTSRIQSWLRDYDRIQSLALIFIYIQIGCALVGSLGALYNGVMLINVAIALFALVAIESSSQSLARIYAVLLFCAILLDILWFILFTREIWNISSEIYGTLAIFSVKLTLSMQIIGCFVRLLSSSLWIQMYRLGISYVDSSAPREADFDMRNSFISPATPAIVRDSSDRDDVLGGSIYDPVYYSSLFEDGQDNGYSYEVDGLLFCCFDVVLSVYKQLLGEAKQVLEDVSNSTNGVSQLKPSAGRSPITKDESAASKFHSV